MTTQRKVEALIRQVAELPEKAREEVVQSLIQMRAEDLGVYHLDAEERATIILNANDVRLGRLA